VGFGQAFEDTGGSFVFAIGRDFLFFFFAELLQIGAAGAEA